MAPFCLRGRPTTTSTASSSTRGALALTKMGSLCVLQPGLAYGLITGELAAMSPAIQHHVLGFSHLLHTSWQSGEGALSFCETIQQGDSRKHWVEAGSVALSARKLSIKLASCHLILHFIFFCVEVCPSSMSNAIQECHTVENCSKYDIKIQDGGRFQINRDDRTTEPPRKETDPKCLNYRR